MQCLQAYKYELMSDGQQRRLMSRFAGLTRFVYNKALALLQSLKDFERAYANFFAKRAAFPRFKRKGVHDSFRYRQQIKLDEMK